MVSRDVVRQVNDVCIEKGVNQHIFQLIWRQQMIKISGNFIYFSEQGIDKSKKMMYSKTVSTLYRNERIFNERL
jgi:hypothetical protein